MRVAMDLGRKWDIVAGDEHAAKSCFSARRESRRKRATMHADA